LCFFVILANLSSGESSKPHSPQKAYLIGELKGAKLTITQKDEVIRQMVFTAHLGQINKNVLQLFPPILKRSPVTNQKIQNPHLQLLYHLPRPQVKKCFKCLGFGHIAAYCPTKRTMMVKGDQVVSEHSDDSSRSNSPSPSKALSEYECDIPCEGDLMMIRRMLGKIPKLFYDTQRENIFHTRCIITNKLCSLIIDGGSCTNVASTRVVEKLSLPTISHTHYPYKLQWLST